MSPEILNRETRSAPRADRRNLIRAAIVLGVLCAGWRLIREPLMLATAVSSVGHPSRSGLLNHAYARKNDLGATDRTQWVVPSARSAKSGYAVVFDDYETNAAGTTGLWRLTITDRQFNIIGRVRATSVRPQMIPDGVREALVLVDWYGGTGDRLWAVFRIGAEGNRLLAILAAPAALAASAPSVILWPHWSDADEDGHPELRVAPHRWKSGAWSWQGNYSPSGPTVLVLAEDAATGMLRIKESASPSSVFCWLVDREITPHEGESEADLIQRLWDEEVGALFARATATAPASAPASAPVPGKQTP